MKKFLIAVFATVMMAVGVHAATATVNGITWTYTVSDGKACITDVPTSVTGYAEIPSEINGYPVTSIGNDAFWNCSGLTSITIPNSVANISSNAFVCCSNLTSAVIGQYVCTNKLSQIFHDSYSTIETIEILALP